MREKYQVIERVGDRFYIASSHRSYEAAKRSRARYERAYERRNPVSRFTSEDIEYRIRAVV